MRQRSLIAQWWFDLPMRYKGLLVVAIPLIGVAAAILVRIPVNQQQQETAALLQEAEATRRGTQALLIDLLDLESAVAGYVLTRDQALLQSYHRVRQSLAETVTTRAVGTTGAETTRLVNHQLALSTELVDSITGGAPSQSPAVQELLREMKHTVDRIRTALNEQQAQHDRQMAASSEELRRLRRLLTPVVLVTFFGGVVGALVAGWLFATGIADRLSALERNAERLANSERLHAENSRGRDEIGSLDRALRRASLLLRKRERELKAVNQRLEHTLHEQTLLNRELEAFSYSVSHDLRAPLRSIDGFAQALREDWGDRLDAAGQDHLSRVRNAAQRMGRLIDDLLKLSKLTRSQVQRMDVDLSQLAHEVAAELTERNPTRSITWRIQDDLHCWCDPSLLRIVLENLLGNAWKFSSKTPAAQIEFQAVPDTAPTVFVVRDNGAGFDMRYVDKLFAPFQRLHAEREFPGTGIGLATIQRIVHKHGGSIRAHGVVGGGAEFYFTLETAENVGALA